MAAEAAYFDIKLVYIEQMGKPALYMQNRYFFCC